MERPISPEDLPPSITFAVDRTKPITTTLNLTLTAQSSICGETAAEIPFRP